jgi:hypothetical protein
MVCCFHMLFCPGTHDMCVDYAQAVAYALNEIHYVYHDLELKPSSRSEIPPLLPYWTTFGNGHRLCYLGRVLSDRENLSCDLYYARVAACPPESALSVEDIVVVKFADTYSRHAHEVLATVGLAPRLHHCEPIDGGPLMVVMDLVHGGSAATLKGPLPTPVMKDVREALDCLHTAGLVFGDLRRPNIMLLNGADTWSRSDGEQGVAGQGTLYASSQPGHALHSPRHADRL